MGRVVQAFRTVGDDGVCAQNPSKIGPDADGKQSAWFSADTTAAPAVAQLSGRSGLTCLVALKFAEQIQMLLGFLSLSHAPVEHAELVVDCGRGGHQCGSSLQA